MIGLLDSPEFASICALLRGESPTWSGTGDDETAIASFLSTARTHGVTPLLDRRFAESADAASWPEALRRACHDDALAQAMHELAHRAELVRVLAALVAAGVAPLLMKGTGLAYSHYPNPALRPRGDTDLLIPRDAADRAESVLRELGYERGAGVRGEFVSHQATWSRIDELGNRHDLDVHWRISNSPVLVKALAYDELAARVRALPLLGPHARALAPVDALLFACMHRAGHVSTPYFAEHEAFIGGDRLIWLYDVHLLVSRMAEAEADEFLRLATAKQMRAICLDALERSRECFGTAVPPGMRAGLQPDGVEEASARYLKGGRARQLWTDFVALDDWSARVGWLREVGFPDADYMRGKYPDAPIGWLPVLYARRALGGLGKLRAIPSPHMQGEGRVRGVSDSSKP